MADGGVEGDLGKCPFKFEALSCGEIAERHKDCTDPDCLVCQFHEALICSD